MAKPSDGVLLPLRECCPTTRAETHMNWCKNYNDIDAIGVREWRGPVTIAAHKDMGKPDVGSLDPEFILAMGQVLTNSNAKYPDDLDGRPNWFKGGKYRSFLGSIGRHFLALMKGEDFDPESGLPHAAHLAIDAMFLYSWVRRAVGDDNRLDWKDPRASGEER